MATETLQVRLLMQSQQYKREARDAASATGAIASQAKTAGTETSRLDRQLGNTGLTMRSAVVGGAAIAGAAVIGFGKDAIRASTDLEESINAVNVVFGDAAAGVLEIGESAADSFGLANSEFNAFAVQFSSFAKTIAQGEGKEVDEVLKGLTGRIADFASVMNIDVAEAAEKFQSGLAGETEPLRKFGIDVSAAAVSQKALEMGLADTTSELTEGDKVLGRYQLLMEQTDDTAGDFKNTQDGLANAQRTLNAEMEDFKARLGSQLTPVLAEAASAGLSFLDILDPDVDLGWTQRLSAGIQLITGEGNEAVESYIAQKEAVNDLTDATGSSAGEFEVLGATIHGVGDASGSSAGEVEVMTGALERAGRKGQTSFADIVTSMEEYETMLARLTDPVFKHLDDQRRLADLQRDYNDAVKEFGEASPEAIDLGFELAAAEAAVRTSAAELPDDLDAATDSVYLLADAAGVADGTLQGMRATMDSLDGRVVEAEIRLAVKRTGAPIDPRTIIGAETGRQHGGPVTAGHPYVVGEAGPELFIPQSSGMVVSNSQMTTGSAVGGGQNINVFTLTWGDFVRKAADAGLEIQRYGW